MVKSSGERDLVAEVTRKMNYSDSFIFFRPVVQECWSLIGASIIDEVERSGYLEARGEIFQAPSEIAEDFCLIVERYDDGEGRCFYPAFRI